MIWAYYDAENITYWFAPYPQNTSVLGGNPPEESPICPLQAKEPHMIKPGSGESPVFTKAQTASCSGRVSKNMAQLTIISMDFSEL